MFQAQPTFEAYSIDHLKLHSFSQEELEGGEMIQLSHCFLCVHASMSQCLFTKLIVSKGMVWNYSKYKLLIKEITNVSNILEYPS